MFQRKFQGRIILIALTTIFLRRQDCKTFYSICVKLPHCFRGFLKINFVILLLWFYSVWPDWALYWTLGSFSKPLATINFPKSPTFLGNFCKGLKFFLVKSFLGNFYRPLATFYWSHGFYYKNIVPVGDWFTLAIAR